MEASRFDSYPTCPEVNTLQQSMKIHSSSLPLSHMRLAGGQNMTDRNSPGEVWKWVENATKDLPWRDRVKARAIVHKPVMDGKLRGDITQIWKLALTPSTYNQIKDKYP